jgi:hypothetical protein
VRKPSRCSTSLIPRGVSHTFAPFPKPERPSFTPDRVTRGSLGGDQAPLLPPKGMPIVWIQVLTSLMDGAPNWFPSLLQVPLCNQDLLSGVLGEAILHQTNRSTGTWQDTVPTSQGCWVLVTKIWKTTFPNLGWAPIHVMGISNRDMGHQGFSWSNIY